VVNELVVRSAAAEEQREAVAVLARAFWNDPLFDAFARDLLHEQLVLPWFFHAVLRDADGLGRIDVAEWRGRPRGVAAWLPPGAYPRPRRADAMLRLRALRAIVRIPNRRLAVRLLDAVDRHHPHDPHWYLAVIGVDPAVQGRGIGAGLIEPVLRDCDAQGAPAYLETQKESNLAWYARFGFERVDEVRLPGAPPVWCLRREPR
jgi:GNAT superfamily N-acetyltransferase